MWDKANLEEVGLVVMVVAQVEVLEVTLLVVAVAQVEVLEVTLLVVAKSVVDTILQYSTNRSIWWETKCLSWWSRWKPRDSGQSKGLSASYSRNPRESGQTRD